jgi:hypothetical protein
MKHGISLARHLPRRLTNHSVNNTCAFGLIEQVIHVFRLHAREFRRHTPEGNGLPNN